MKSKSKIMIKRSIVLFVFNCLIGGFLYYNASCSLGDVYYTYAICDLRPTDCKLKVQSGDGIILTKFPRNNRERVQEVIKRLEDDIKDSGDIPLQIFINVLQFDITVENFLEAKNSDGEDVRVKFTIGRKADKYARDTYAEARVGQRARFLEALTLCNIKKMDLYVFDYRLIPDDDACKGQDSIVLEFENDKGIDFHIELARSWVNAFIFFVIAIPVTWAIFLLYFSIRKWIFTNSDHHKVIRSKQKS